MNSTLESVATEPQVAERDSAAIPRAQKVLGTAAICLRFGVSRHTWHRWVKSGEAPAPAPLPGHPRWRVDDIERFERGRQGRR